MRCTPVHMRAAAAASLLLAATATAQPDIPAVTRPITLMVGDSRAQIITTPVTYFGGSKQGDIGTRIHTYFGGMFQGDAGAREISLERGTCTDPLLAPVITLQPESARACNPGSDGQFRIEATGPGRVTYLWLIDVAAGVWEPLSGFPLQLPCGGFARAVDFGPNMSLTIDGCEGQTVHRVKCIVANACGAVESRVVVFQRANQIGEPTWSGPLPVVPASRPPQSQGGVTAYDTLSGTTIYFGGRNGGVNFNQTWTWDGIAWQQLQPTHRPPGRAGAMMATLDRQPGGVLLFGGYGPGLDGFDDTWEWDGTDWHLRVSSGQGPGPRTLGSMTYDSVRDRVVLFGGYDNTGDTQQTWEYDPAALTWSLIPTAVAPPARHGAMMAFDARRGRTVLFGGENVSFLSDLWEWDGTTWTQRLVPGPQARSEGGMVYDPVLQRVRLTGGWRYVGGPSVYQYFADVWDFDGAAWVERTAYGVPPTARHQFSTSFDRLRNKLIVFGGLNSQQSTLNDVWELALGDVFITEQPESAAVISGSDVEFRVAAIGADLFEWRRDGVPLVDDARISGSATAVLTILAASASDVGAYSCVVSNACHQTLSLDALLSICSADFNADGGVDGSDIDAFFIAWESGDSLADVNFDGGVDGSDVSVFFAAWENGGC